MNRCNNCNVLLYESEKKCPLCKSKISSISQTNVEYPEYKNIIQEKSPLKNLPLFVSSTIILICLYINIFTYDPGEIFWAFIVTSSVLYIFLSYKLARTKTKKYGSKILYAYLFLSAFLFIIDLITGFNLWSLNYVLPFLTIAVTVYLTALAIRNKRGFTEYFAYILAVLAIDVVSTVFDLLAFGNASWGEFATVITCLIIALFLYLFADKSLKDEVKKRFHR
ncbi:MAG: DUF6320 domain-containing protein [Clostridia bacterium]